ncbi:putative F-box protein [Cardamine amara subsp. amara]|uniref:F-box protein n=1 Tax=Cardamine amara subsp. amara TaxID=228776 RepID=A0ABD1C0K0_CARAN
MSGGKIRVDRGGDDDLISSLPDEVIGKILSNLPTHVAASTSVLSKRWRNLLPLVDKIELSDVSVSSGGCPLGFPEFVEKKLSSLLSNNSMIKSFHLNCEHKHEESRVNGWIRTVLERGCLLKIHLETVGMYRIDTEFFTSNTLVELTICDGFYPAGRRLPREGVFFPALKKLSLVSVAFSDYPSYEDLVFGCPVLEELFLHYPDDYNPPAWDGYVLSPSIKRLTIFHDYPDYRQLHDLVYFQTPSLVYLDYSGHVSRQYDVDFLGSLVEARLNLRPWDPLIDDDSDSTSGSDSDSEDDYDYPSSSDSEDDAFRRGVTALVSRITNVKTLHLSSDSLEVFHFLCESMPVFHNLLELSFESDKDKGWQVVPLLLNSSPNLVTLSIKGLVHKVTNRCGDACICIIPKMKMKMKKKQEEEGVCCLSTCQLKVLNISGYRGTCRELKQMSHFLANFKCLETVKVGVEVDHREDNDPNKTYLRITNALMKLPRVSSNCRIHFL